MIKSVQEFLDKLSVGDCFYYMTSWGLEPDKIVGPFVITNIRKGGIVEGSTVMCDQVVCEFIDPWSSSNAVFKSFVGDLTNPYHGVFTDSIEAHKYCEAQKFAYKTDPKLIAEAEEYRRYLYNISNL